MQVHGWAGYTRSLEIDIPNYPDFGDEATDKPLAIQLENFLQGNIEQMLTDNLKSVNIKNQNQREVLFLPGGT